MLYNILHMERFTVKPLTLPVGGSDVFLVTAHDLFESKSLFKWPT